MKQKTFAIVCSSLLALFFPCVVHGQNAPKPYAGNQYRHEYFGDLAERLSKEYNTPLHVKETTKVSGVYLFTSLEGVERERVLPALASFFSHRGAVSYWDDADKGKYFVLSSRYEQKLNHEYWSQKLIKSFKDVLKYHDAPDSVKKAFDGDRMTKLALTKPESFDCVQLMAKLFDEKDISAILHGEKTASIKISEMKGENHKLAEKLFQHNAAMIGDKEEISNETELIFKLESSNSEDMTRALFVSTQYKDSMNRGVGQSFLGFAHEESAQEEMRDFWIARGDTLIPLGTGKETPGVTDIRTDAIPDATFFEKFKRISQKFHLPIIAVLPSRVTPNTLYTSSSLQDTLQHLSDEGEPLFAKINHGVLMVCPASFLQDKGTTDAIPLATIREWNALPKNKDGYCWLLDEARVALTLNDTQRVGNAHAFQSFDLIQDWRQLLRSILRSDSLADQLKNGEAVAMDKDIAIAFNALQRPPGAKAVAPGDTLRMRELVEPMYLHDLPKRFPRDFNVHKTIVFTVSKPDGERVAVLTGDSYPTNAEYIKHPLTPKE